MRRLIGLALVGLLAAAPSRADALRVGLSVDNPSWSFVPERMPALIASAGDTPLPPVAPAAQGAHRPRRRRGPRAGPGTGRDAQARERELAGHRAGAARQALRRQRQLLDAAPQDAPHDPCLRSVLLLGPGALRAGKRKPSDILRRPREPGALRLLQRPVGRADAALAGRRWQGIRLRRCDVPRPPAGRAGRRGPRLDLRALAAEQRSFTAVAARRSTGWATTSACGARTRSSASACRRRCAGCGDRRA